MADPTHWPGGLGLSSGSALLTAGHMLTSTNVWYVHSGTGSDAAGPRGKDQVRPLATTAQAMTNSSAGDWIVYLSGHTETITSSVAIGGARVFASAGIGNDRARITRGANIVLFGVSAAGVWFDNIYFPQSTVAAASTRINMGAQGKISGCYFECGANDTGAAVDIGGSVGVQIVGDTYFVSTGTALTAQPSIAVQNSINTATDLTMDKVVFNGGSVGWSNQFAFQGTQNIARIAATNIDLLNDSDMTITSGSSGFIQVRNKSGSSRIVWP